MDTLAPEEASAFVLMPGLLLVSSMRQSDAGAWPRLWAEPRVRNVQPQAGTLLTGCSTRTASLALLLPRDPTLTSRTALEAAGGVLLSRASSTRALPKPRSNDQDVTTIDHGPTDGATPYEANAGPRTVRPGIAHQSMRPPKTNLSNRARTCTGGASYTRIRSNGGAQRPQPQPLRRWHGCRPA